MKDYYDNSTARGQILNAARRIFYDEGYNEASFTKIAECSDNSRSNITYHFKTKLELGHKIHEDIARDNTNITSRILLESGNYVNVQVATMVSMLVTLNIYKDDPKVYRFYYELINNGFDKIYTEQTLNFYKLHDRNAKLNIDHEGDELTMLAYSAKGAVNSLLIAYFGRILNTTFEKFCIYRLRIPFVFMRFSEKEIDTIIEQAFGVFKKLQINIDPYFYFDLKMAAQS